MRRFNFEDELYRSLSCLPMVAKYKLDRAGLKVSQRQWLALEIAERQSICEAPDATVPQMRDFSAFVRRLVQQRCGEPPTPLSLEQRKAAVPPSELPPMLIERAQTVGLELNQALWNALADDERYALIKLGGGPLTKRNFGVALTEFLHSRT
jgi:hypothetical protein